MSAPSPLVSVVVPSRNESGNVGPLWERLQRSLAEVPFEVCFVDDSEDDTPGRIAALQAEHREIRCLHRTGEERAGGLSTAVIAGLHMAAGRYVCVMDADLQHPPETIPVLLARAEAGADLVVASRYAPGGSRRGLSGVARRVVSRAATDLARLLFPEARQSRDPLSGFFLCRRGILDGIEFRPVGFKILLELLVCVPALRVVDVPVAQEARGSGQSKASFRQGLLYLGHLRSLVVDVPGSARILKFGVVGLSGLAVFLPMLWALSTAGRLHPLVAFIPAFALSAVWNTTLNWLWTFADQRRAGGRGPRHYLGWALLSGVPMFGVFAVLWRAGVPVLLAGLGAALVAMVANGLVNRGSVRRAHSAWAQVALDQGVQAGLGRLSAAVGADRAYVVPALSDAAPSLPPGLLNHVISDRRPLLLTEGASHRLQRRSNIERWSRLVLPVVLGEDVVAVVICERYAPIGFEAQHLETATSAVADLVPALAQAARAGEPLDARPARSATHPAA